MNILKWARYFSYIPLRKIIGRIFHSLIILFVSWAPRVFIKKSRFYGLVSGEGMKDFSLVYQCMGDRFYDADLINVGVFSIKGVAKDFGSVDMASWDNPFPQEPEKLHWVHDFSFFSYSIALVRNDAVRGVETVSRLLSALERTHPIGRGNFHFVWTPIALSLRVMGLSTAVELARQAGVPSESEELKVIRRHIAYCADLLDLTAERYLGYNHTAFSETALAVSACMAGKMKACSEYSDAAARIICKHVLSDGLWEERSPTYHIHMLLLARGVLALGAISQEMGDILSKVAERMTQALSAIVHVDGEIAVLNDAAIEDSVAPSAVGWKLPTAMVSCVVLAKSGYALLRNQNTSLVFDAGIMGPDDVIGHGHGDFLSIDLCWRGERLIVDPGVASITGGIKRQKTRSAHFHNGPGYLEREPAEFFGTWRVGRRGRADFFGDVSRFDSDCLEVFGWCDGYAPFTKGGIVARKVKMFSEKIILNDMWPINDGDLFRRVFFLVPSAWKLTTVSDTQVLLESEKNKVGISLSNAIFKSFSLESWNPKGPISPQSAHGIEIWISHERNESEIVIFNCMASGGGYGGT